MYETIDADQMVDALIDREGGFVNCAADKGGPTYLGITETVARAHGYTGAMLPREEVEKQFSSTSSSTGFAGSIRSIQTPNRAASGDQCVNPSAA